VFDQRALMYVCLKCKSYEFEIFEIIQLQLGTHYKMKLGKILRS